MAIKDLKIFKANEIRYSELSKSAFTYLKDVYNTNGEEFTMSSPFAQIISVTLHLGRMILFYIENTITELNIETAFHNRSIRGLATLTGHNPSRGIGARGALYMSYNMDSTYLGETISFKNFTRVVNTSNNLPYVVVLPSPNMTLSVGQADTKVELPIIQGTVKYQQATGSGYALQSFNFANKADDVIDNFFVNIYVNGTKFEIVDSILDMTYRQKACIVKTALNGGIDVFFGTENSGYIPPVGATIVCEYLVTNGERGNINTASDDNYWKFIDGGYDIEGNYVDLNSIYNLTSASDIIFGAESENLYMTKQLAPHMSRSFVLANPVNYKCFLSKLNIFSVIDAFSGFNTLEDSKAESAYINAKNEYSSVKESYLAQVSLTGKTSAEAEKLYDKMVSARGAYDNAKIKYEDTKMDDNVVYLYLVPDLKKRLGENENYFTCDLDRFKLTDDEKTGILNLIDDSGCSMITVENRILDPVFVKFSMNIFVQMWDDYNFASVKSEIISAISAYLTSGVRRDRIPISDIMKVVESVKGVDSVTAFFDADKNNSKYYGENNYGIDDYGDIVLKRNVSDKLGNVVEINDLMPLFRGNFTSFNDVYYEDDIDSLVAPVNITLRGVSSK